MALGDGRLSMIYGQEVKERQDKTDKSRLLREASMETTKFPMTIMYTA